jgi:hypothetical protein
MMILHGDVKTSWIQKSSLGRSVGIVGGHVIMLKIFRYEISNKSNSEISNFINKLLISFFYILRKHL